MHGSFHSNYIIFSNVEFLFFNTFSKNEILWRKNNKNLLKYVEIFFCLQNLQINQYLTLKCLRTHIGMTGFGHYFMFIAEDEGIIN
jgi:hypothetical protein